MLLSYLWQCKKLQPATQYDAIIALGAVIRGGTPHFEYVAGECTKGIAQVMMQYGLPVSFGVLTVESIEQAIERAGTKMGNKGGEAASVCAGNGQRSGSTLGFLHETECTSSVPFTGCSRDLQLAGQQKPDW